MRGDGSLFRRGEVWWINYSRDGKRVQMSCKTTKRSVALAKLRQLQSAGEDEFLGRTGKRVTVGDLMDKLFEHYAAEGKHEYRHDSQQSWLQHMRESFGDLRASQLTTAHQQVYRAKRVGEGARGTTINRELALIGSAYRLASRHEPPLVVRLPRIVLVSEAGNARKGYATRAQFDALKQAASDKVGLWFRVFLELAVLLGWRRGELEGLCARNVDLLDNFIRIEDSKNGEPRQIPIPTEIRPMLEALLVGKKPGDQLFKGAKYKAWKKTREAAGVPHLLLHDFRRTSARFKRAAGIDATVVQEMMGWRSGEMLRRYRIVGHDDKEEALRKQASYLEQTTTPATENKPN